MNEQTLEQQAEMIAKFRTPPGFSWADLKQDIITLCTSRETQRHAEPRQEGMVMVPVEPTDEMIDRACTYWKLYPAFEGQKPQPTAGEIARFIYTSMLAARPTKEDK